MSNPAAPTRRTVVAGFAAAAAVSLLPLPALAFSVDKAQGLIDNVVADILTIINSGKPEAAMLKDFQKVFTRYADTDTIAQLVLGVEWRSASSSQRKAFAQAFEGYITRKYGRRFREFIGGRIEVKDAKAVKSFYEVTTMTYMQGQAPFEVIYVVSDKSGRFIDMKIEGISLVKSERSEVGAMLDTRGGNLNDLIAHLNTL